MADKKFLDAMKNKFSEDPTDKRTTFYNMGGWKQSERKSAFVKEGKEIAEKRACRIMSTAASSPCTSADTEPSCSFLTHPVTPYFCAK